MNSVWLDAYESKEQADSAKDLYEQILEKVGVKARIEVRPHRLPCDIRTVEWCYAVYLIIDPGTPVPEGLAARLARPSRRR
jgi:hypothetical protein